MKKETICTSVISNICMYGTHYVLVFNFLVFSQANKAKDDSLNLLKDHGPGHSRVMFLYI